MDFAIFHLVMEAQKLSLKLSDEDFRDIATNSLFTVYDLIICEYKYRYFSLSFVET